MQEILDLFTATESIDIIELGADIILSAIMSGFIYFAFIRFASTLSNRKQFGRIFFLVAVCTTLIIAVIKSSIALSLGLVGALSIIRFRAAIKEPEELAYLFLCIATGLGFGAGLRVITCFAVVLILVIVVIRGLLFKQITDDTYNFSVNTEKLTVDDVIQTISQFSESIKVRRVDSGKNALCSLFVVEFKSISRLENAMDALKTKDEDISVSFISNETLM
ncbi:DUF4956 domain-containing protein [Synergistales bacterium]|nr:DUF4956 domain-containing protein [Synergistales bacterium]